MAKREPAASESSASDRGIGFHPATPIVPVRDLEASLAYYVRVLGFREGFKVAGFAAVSRGPASLYLCEGGQGHLGTWLWIGVSDAGRLHDELRKSGARIRFGSDPREGEPFGAFLDMHGRLRPTT